MTEVDRSGRDFPPPTQIETPNGSTPIGQNDGPNDYVHFTMRMLF